MIGMWWWWRYCCGASISCQIVGRLQRPLPIRTVLVVITIVSVSVVISAYIILSSCPSNHSLRTPHPETHLVLILPSGQRIHQLDAIVGKKPLKCVELRINRPLSLLGSAVSVSAAQCRILLCTETSQAVRACL